MPASLRRTPRATREWLYIAVPLLLFAGDLIVSPVLLENSVSLQRISAVTLLEERLVKAGAFRGHEIEFGLDQIVQPSYLTALSTRHPNALAISSFADDSGHAALGAVGKAVEAKLKSVSPADATRFHDSFTRQAGYIIGDVRELSLMIPREKRAAFPVDRIFIAILENDSGTSNQKGDVFKKILPRLMRRSNDSGIDTLVVPILGYNWRDGDTIATADFFRALLGSLPGDAPRPTRLYVDLYSAWPTYVIEGMVADFNVTTEQIEQPVRRLHRLDERLLELLLMVALLVCSRYIVLRWKWVLPICASYATLFFGATTAIQFFTTGLSVRLRDALEIAVCVVLALAFPIIAQWNPKQIFPTEEVQP